MKMWKRYCAGLAVAAGLSTGVYAQPGVPGVPAGPVVPGAVPLAPAAPPSTLWTWLGISKPQRAACKEAICQSQIGQLMNNGMAPISALTGGILGGCCPPALSSDLAQPADSALGAAARVKADEAGVAARIAAVRYLATVDCNRWPEAKAALIDALRHDRSECVRFEGAKALGTGCCCNRDTMEALSISTSGSTRDGNPRETSERVRETARESLEHCLTRLGPVQLPLLPSDDKREGEKPREGVAPPKPGTASSADYYIKTVASMSDAEVIQNARKAVERPKPANGITVAMKAPRGEAGVVGIIMGSFTPVTPPSTTPPPVAVAEKATPAAPATDIKPVGYEEQSTVPTATPAAVPRTTPEPMPQATAPKTLADASGLMVTLSRASYFGDRVWAAQGLAGIDGRMNPHVVDALMLAARKDSAPAVRAECVRTLTTTGVGLVKVEELFQELHNDPDPGVREAVDQALKHSSSQGATKN